LNKEQTNKLKKSDLCRYIARHYTVRGNLISAIAGALPLSSTPCFCLKRIISLERGNLCMPKGYEKMYSQTAEEVIPQLYPFIDYFFESECLNKNGTYLSKTKEEMDAIMTGSDELEIKYKQMVMKMRDRYYESLKKLRVILERLLEDIKLTNEDLKNLSIETKDILDSMYSECQYDYILGIVALMQIQYKLPKLQEESKNKLLSVIQSRI
jgi:hypothetical protein